MVPIVYFPLTLVYFKLITTLNELYTNYNNLLSKGDASASNILTGKKVLVKGKEVTGTMANNGSVSKSLAAGGSYTIPAGYHDGTGKVTANSLASQTSATATAAQILSGKTAYVNGSKVTGTMTNKAGTTVEASAVSSDDNNTYLTIPTAGYYDQNSKIYTENSNSVTTDLSKIAILRGQQGANYWLSIFNDNVVITRSVGGSASNDYFEIGTAFIKANKSGKYKAIGAYPVEETYFQKGATIASGNWNTAGNPFSSGDNTIYVFIG